MSKEYRIYRANNAGTGTATKWQLSYKEQNKFDKYMVFLTIAAQIGKDENDNAKFDWDKGITVKLGENDIGELLATMSGRKTAAGYNGSLFHQSPKGNKVIKFSLSDKSNAFYLNVSSQGVNKEEKAIQMSQVVNEADVEILTVLLKKAIERIYEW